jgi:hypothetical protein
MHTKSEFMNLQKLGVPNKNIVIELSKLGIEGKTFLKY